MKGAGYELLKNGQWIRPDDPEVKIAQALVDRVWEQDGPKHLELLARSK
jgi:hypothetical protein